MDLKKIFHLAANKLFFSNKTMTFLLFFYLAWILRYYEFGKSITVLRRLLWKRKRENSN